MKKVLLLLFPIVLLVCSCGPLAVVSGGEVLDTLTKVTDADEPCAQPFGGDNGKNLFYAGRSSGQYWNIYYKENAFSSAVGEKTSGKNRNSSPAYCDATKKIAFSCQNEGMSTTDIYMMNSNQGRALRADDTGTARQTADRDKRRAESRTGATLDGRLDHIHRADAEASPP